MKTIVFIVIAIPAILIALLILKGIDHLFFTIGLERRIRSFVHLPTVQALGCYVR